MNKFIEMNASELSPALIDWTIGTFIENKKLVPNWKNNFSELYFLVDGSGSSDSYSPITKPEHCYNLVSKYRISINDVGSTWISSMVSTKNGNVISASDKDMFASVCKLVIKSELEQNISIPEILL